MARAQTLKAALDRHKSVDHKLERQKKLQKQAEKRKRQKISHGEDDGALEGTLEGAQDAFDKLQQQLGAEEEAADGAEALEAVGGDAQGWETDESGNDEDKAEVSEDEGNSGLILQAFDDESESESELEDNVVPIANFKGVNTKDEHDEDDDEDEEESGEGDGEEEIPLSDVEELDEEDKGDIIPYQRLTINNTAALTRSLKSFSLPTNIPFSATQSVTSAEPVEIADVEDDLNRELAFYKQSLDAVKEARAKLKAEKMPFSRPPDYFAEMVKTEEQMGKVKQKMVDEAARKKASQDARRQRDLKKFGKAVQVAKIQERDKAKRDTLDKINVLKRKRQGGADLTANENDAFDVAIEDAADTEKKDRAARRASGGRDQQNRSKRAKKDEKFGFGGKKRFAKSNDARSTSDDRGYSVKRMKGVGRGGGKQRPGKSRRANM